MKSQLSCILFALVVPLAACSGDRASSTPTDKPRVTESAPAQVPAIEPKIEPATVKVEAPKPVVKDEKPARTAPETYAACITEGKALVDKGEHAQARELFEAAAKLDRKKAEPYVELARSYIATNDKSLAMKAARKAVKLAPESSQAYNTLGRAELLRHNYDDAIVAFRQATELNADNVWAWNNLGFTHLELKHYKEAIDALESATKLKGAEGYMFNNLGTAYEQLDQLDDARDAFEKGAALGSVAAKASRKRLEGVATLAVAKKTDKVEDKTYPIREEMPDLDQAAQKPELEAVTPDDTEKSEDKAVDKTDKPADKADEKPVAPTPNTL